MINMPGGPELLVIFLVALIVIGPQQLPKAMRSFGNVMAEVRKVSSSFQEEMKNAMDSVVDSTATEKPQSGSMASAEPRPSATVSDDTDELIVRNEGPYLRTDSIETDGVEQPAPTIDPADRAAG